MLLPYRDEAPSRTYPIFTILLIVANTVVYLLTLTQGSLELAVARFGFTPETMLHHPEVAITSTFLHANLLHLLSNMWFLWIFGDNIEDRFGRLPFLLLYLLSGVAGNLTNALLTGFDAQTPVIGASGAVAGIMGSYLVRFPLARVRSVFFIIFYPIRLRVPALLLLGLWMAGEFWSAIVAVPGDFVAHWAHVGGFLLGAIWTWGRRDRYYRAKGWWW
jgi:membrane associated rhomboid family serine protease